MLIGKAEAFKDIVLPTLADPVTSCRGKLIHQTWRMASYLGSAVIAT